MAYGKYEEMKTENIVLFEEEWNMVRKQFQYHDLIIANKQNKQTTIYDNWGDNYITESNMDMNDAKCWCIRMSS